MKVFGGSICGMKKQGPFILTGEHKGNYTLYVCDKRPHDEGEHRDSSTGKRWR